MSALFASGHAVDLVLLFVALEAALLLGLRRRTGSGLPAGDVALALMPGLALMLALRSALVGDGWPWIAAWLIAALLAHGLDLRRRWRAAGQARS